MHDNEIIFHQIRAVHSPYKLIFRIPIQRVSCCGIKGTIVSGGIYAAL